MCGRFTLSTPEEILRDVFQIPLASAVGHSRVTDSPPPTPPATARPRDSEATVTWRARYNVAPTQGVLAVRQLAADEPRRADLLTWGLIPSWADDHRIGARMINARSETLRQRPSFRSAYKSRRCLVLADGFYEWKMTPEGKQPLLIRVGGGAPFAMAGLWERWRGPGDTPIESCTIITTQANDVMSRVHDRMPVILPDVHHALWLDPGFKDTEQLSPLLVPRASDGMSLTPVSKRVNNVRNDDATCVETVAPSQAAAPATRKHVQPCLPGFGDDAGGQREGGP